MRYAIHLLFECRTVIPVYNIQVIDEDELPPDDPRSTGAEHFNDHRSVWGEYLVPGCEQFSTFRKA